MNARFWEWIATINARLVFLWTSLICLCLVSFGILLGERRPTALEPILILGDPQVLAKGGMPALRVPAPSASEEAKAAEDPFVSGFLASLLREQEQHRGDAAPHGAQVAQPAEPEETPPPETPPAPMGPPRQAQLLYRGMFTRPDGTVLALIENQTSGNTTFLLENDQVEGLLIGRISRTEVSLSGPGKNPVILSAGVLAHIDLEP